MGKMSLLILPDPEFVRVSSLVLLSEAKDLGFWFRDDR